MKKNIIKSLLSLILSFSLLITGLGLTVHADGGGGSTDWSNVDLLSGFYMTINLSEGGPIIVDSTNSNDHVTVNVDVSKIKDVTMQYGLKIPDSSSIKSGDTYSFSLPVFFEGHTTSPQEIRDTSDDTILYGTYEIANGKLTITFAQDVEDYNGKEIFVKFMGDFDTKVFDDSELVEVEIPFSDDSTFTATIVPNKEDRDWADTKEGIPFTDTDSDGNPIRTDIDPEYIYWTVTVNDEMKDLNKVVFYDNFSSDDLNLSDILNLNEIKVEIYKLTRNYKNETIRWDKVEDAKDPQLTTSRDGFTIELGDIEDAYEIRYITKINRPAGGDGPFKISNSAGLTYSGGKHEINEPAEVELNWTVDMPTIKKSGKTTDKPQILDWEILYNFNQDDNGTVYLVDFLKYKADSSTAPVELKVLDVTKIKVYKATNIGFDKDGKIVYNTELINNYSGPTIEKDKNSELITNFTFDLDTAGGQAYFITFSTEVPVGLNGIVTNFIEDNLDPKNSDYASINVDTIPKGGKIGEQLVDDEGNPYIEWTITLNEDRVKAGKVMLFDSFNESLLSFVNSEDYKPVLYKLNLEEGNEVREQVDSGYVVAYPYTGSSTDPNDTRHGFLLTIENVGSDKYEFVYRTYYTATGMKQPNIANNVDISFIYDEGTGTGGGVTLDPIKISVKGPKPGVKKTGEYAFSENRDEQKIKWEFNVNESRIKLNKGSTITDVFGGNYKLIGDLDGIVVQAFGRDINNNDEEITFTKDTDYHLYLTYDTNDPTKVTGFEINLLKDTTAKIVVSYVTTVDPANVDQVNTVTLKWQGETETDSATVKARHTALNKGFEIIIDEYGIKTIEWSITFNTPDNVVGTEDPAPPHVLKDVVISDTLSAESPGVLSSGFKITDIKLYRGNNPDPLEAGKEGDYTITQTNTGFEIKIDQIDAVPYKITYKTALSRADEDISILNNAGIRYTGQTDPNTNSKKVVASTLVLNKSFVNKSKGENENPIVNWKIEANAAPNNYLKNLEDAELTDIIPSDQKLIPGTIVVEKVLTTDENEDITNSLKNSGSIIENVDLDGFTIKFDNGAFKYIVTFQTEIQHYPSVTSELHETDYEDLFADLAAQGKQEKHFIDIYTNRAVLTDGPEGAREEAVADAWFEYFGRNKSNLTDKKGAQNVETEDIDWVVDVNKEGLIIYDPIFTDTISSNQTYVAGSIKVWTQYDEIDETKRVPLDTLEYDIIDPYKNTDGTWSFKIIFSVADGETYTLDKQLTITYSTRLDPNEYGSAIKVSNRFVLTGKNSEFEYVNSSKEVTTQQWFYGGGGTGKQLEFGIAKQSPEEISLSGAKFKLERVKLDGSKVTIMNSNATDDYIVTGPDGKYFYDRQNYGLLAGRYILTETDAPAGYIANDPIYFAVGYTNDPNKYRITLMTVNDEGVWSIDENNSYSDIVSVEGNQMTITNNYAPIAVELEASKLLEGQRVSAEENNTFGFQFELLDSDKKVLATGGIIDREIDGKKDPVNVVFSGEGDGGIEQLKFYTTGEYEFYIREANNDPRFAHNDTLYMVVVVVSESKGGVGGLEKPTVTYYRASSIEGETPSWVELGEEELPVFNNYYSARIVLEAQKILYGRRLNKDEFRFKLTEWPAEGSKSTEPKEVTNDANGLITFPEITFDTPGDYYYIIEELQGSAGGVVYDDSVIVVTVNVAYNEDSGKLEASIEGYYRTVLGEDGLPVIVEGEGDIPYPEENKLPTFTNRYTAAPNVAIIEGRKVLEGKDLTAGMFSFDLLDSKGEVIETVKNKADGHIGFAEITYHSAGDYNYTIREVKGTAKDGITYDETVHEVTVRVTDGGNGQLYTDVIYKDDKIPTFTNTYKAAATRANLTAHKTLSGKTLTANQFSFELVDQDGKVIETVKNKADGSISFTALNYDTAGEYSYTIREVKGSEPGVTYDKTVHQVTVKVTDDKEGKLHAEVVYANGKAPTFKNSFSEEGIGSQFPTEPGDESKPGIPQTGEGRSTSALGLALIVAGLAFGLLSWRQRPRKRFSGQE